MTRRGGRKRDGDVAVDDFGSGITPEKVRAIIENALRGGFGLDTNDTASVYVMEAGDRAVKIGVSRKVGQRVTAIQVGQQEKTVVFWAVTLAREEAFAIEKMAHRVLEAKGLRAKGEWFWVSAHDAVDCILGCIKRAGYKSSVHLAYGHKRDL